MPVSGTVGKKGSQVNKLTAPQEETYDFIPHSAKECGLNLPYNGTPLRGAYKPGDEKYPLKKIDYKFIDKFQLFIKAVERFYRFEIVTPEHVPSGPCLFVVNHTFASIEPWFGMFNLYERTGIWEISGVLDRHWFKFPIIRDLMIKTGNICPDKEVINATIKQGNKVGILVGGIREAYKSSQERYRINWNNRRGEPKLGFIRIALENQIPIIPLSYIGSEEIFYVSKIKTQFFIKSGLINYELPYAVFRPFPYKIYEVYGPPIYLNHPPEAVKDEEVMLECFRLVKDKFMENMQRGLSMKEENTRKQAARLFKSQHPKLLKILQPYC